LQILASATYSLRSATYLPEMKDIRILSLDQLKDYFESLGEKPFRAKQVYDWLWSKNLHSIDEMTNLSKSLRERIAEEYTINPVSVDLLQKSTDGSVDLRHGKYLNGIRAGISIG